MKYYIAIDNGVTGSICILNDIGELMMYEPTPVHRCLNYTKKKEFLNRVDGAELHRMLKPYADSCSLIIERPMVSPQRWKASVSAIRCDEATLIVLELLNISHQYVDSKEWQTSMLPKRPAPPGNAKKGASDDEKKSLKKKRAAYQAETKTLSLAVGKRLFPRVDFKKDADAALMAEYARKEKL